MKDSKQECKCVHKHKDIDYCHDRLNPKQDRLRDKLERIVIDAQLQARDSGFAEDSMKYVEKLLLLFQKYALGIIGEDGEITGLPFIDEPNIYNNLLRKEQRAKLKELV